MTDDKELDKNIIFIPEPEETETQEKKRKKQLELDALFEETMKLESDNQASKKEK
jgi:hypothetical protein